jgi:arylformamidase
MPRIYDISINIEASMPAYPGDPKFHDQTVKSFDEGDAYQLHRVSLGNHCGTHVDAPSHFIPGGATVTELPLEVLNGRVRVVEIHNSEKVDVAELQQLVLPDDFRILFKTRNSLLWQNKNFEKDFIYLTEKGASYLTENGIKLVGIDYLSIDRYGDEAHPAHKVLLSNNVIIVEGLNLAEVEEGAYEMSCLPLKLHGLDAAPARVILKG